MKTLIVIPTYNERLNVSPMCEQILALGLDADLVFIDDSSPDGTGALLEELAAKHARVRVLHRPGKAGIGSAHQAGIALAYDEGYARLVTLDCDFTHSPQLIPVFLERAEGAPVVVGSRYIESDSLPGWTLVRKILTGAGHVLTKSLLGVSEDATGAFRAYDTARVPREVFSLVRSTGYSFFFESLLVLARNGLPIAEVPITLPARTAGHSKMSFAEIGRSVEMLATLYWESRTDPDRFLLPRNRRP
jgi:dolichol-phosphate mannosyltransferase